MSHWKNWSGRLQAKPKRLHFIRSEADAAALAKDAQQQQLSLRVSGAGHSHAPLVTNTDIIADCSGLSGVITTDAALAASVGVEWHSNFHPRPKFT